MGKPSKIHKQLSEGIVETLDFFLVDHRTFDLCSFAYLREGSLAHGFVEAVTMLDHMIPSMKARSKSN